MSYILDALRKSEQQRQAIQPDTVTDRILVNMPQPKQRPTRWIIALVIGNLLVIAYLFLFFTHKSNTESQPKLAVNVDTQSLASTSAKQQLPPVPAESEITQKPAQSLAQQTESKSPSIAQLIEARKAAESERPIKQVPEKKSLATKKEPAKRSAITSTIRTEMQDRFSEQPQTSTKRKGMLTLDDLPYEVRNTLPNLNINVFSYAEQPEDRFVIIDMVKYKTGQHIKGSVALKEIRPDSIILQYNGDTFRVERH